MTDAIKRRSQHGWADCAQVSVQTSVLQIRASAGFFRKLLLNLPAERLKAQEWGHRPENSRKTALAP